MHLLTTLNDERVHLIGHSYGAYLALIVAMRRPNLIGRLVLAEPPIIPLFTSFPPKPHEILTLLATQPMTALPIIRFAATGLGPATAAAQEERSRLGAQTFR